MDGEIRSRVSDVSATRPRRVGEGFTAWALSTPGFLGLVQALLLEDSELVSKEESNA